MQRYAGLELLTTAEAAAYLRLKERKLYELVAEQAIPCTKVTGKWLFPRHDLDRWVLAGMARPAGVMPADPPPIVGGSHDPLLQWALSESRAGLAIMPEGSEAGYRRLLRGEVAAAAIHFHDVENPERDANLNMVANDPALYDAVLIGFAVREQGLLVAAGNPHRISLLGDVVAKGLKMARRPDGAGAQQLLEALLRREQIAEKRLKIALTAPTGPDIAQAVRSGEVDCGIATRTVALAAGIDFVPLTRERFDLLMRQRDSYRPALQTLLRFLASPRLKTRAAELGGLDAAPAGEIRWAP